MVSRATKTRTTTYVPMDRKKVISGYRKRASGCSCLTSVDLMDVCAMDRDLKHKLEALNMPMRHPWGVFGVDISPDSRMIASSGADRVVRILRVED